MKFATNNEYKVTVKIRNNLILKAIEQAGYEPGGKLAKTIGVGYVDFNNLINLTDSPLYSNGTLRPIAAKLCDFFHKLPEELWTDEQLTPLESNTSEIEATFSQIQQYLPCTNDPFIALESAENQSEFDALLDSLPDKQRIVISYRFGIGCEKLTLEEIAKKIGVTRERISQIEMKALRKLRHPSSGAANIAIDMGILSS